MDVVMCNIGASVSSAVAGRWYDDPSYLAQVSDDPQLPTLRLAKDVCTLTNVPYGTARGFAVKMIDRRTVRDPMMRTIRYEVENHPTFRRDPSWRTRWVVSVGDTQIFVQDKWSSEPGARRLLIDRRSDELYTAPKVNVGCCHYRPPDDPQWPHDFTVGSMLVEDRWQRDHKYVRWHRAISWQDSDENGPKVDEDGYPIYKSKLRRSAIHKTDIWERCKFSDRGSNRPCGEEGIIYMDELPAPVRDGFRNELCPYCFT
ncbi:hypothetical protein [Mycolicibacterium agri]|nr:hypothetical protein [Mycolicibacterium agri]GFG50120.1 hypothetical protein MAGR_15610 [Mycolicibacterium agri]